MGTPLNSAKSVLITEVWFGEREHYNCIHATLLPPICVLSTGVSFLESVLWQSAYTYAQIKISMCSGQVTILNTHKKDKHFYITIYSQTCIQRLPLGSKVHVCKWSLYTRCMLLISQLRYLLDMRKHWWRCVNYRYVPVYNIYTKPEIWFSTLYLKQWFIPKTDKYHV